MPYSEYARPGQPIRSNPRLNGGYPSFSSSVMRNVKSSGYGLPRHNRSAHLHIRPTRRTTLPPRAVSQQADSTQQGRRLSKSTLEDADLDPPIAQPRELRSPVAAAAADDGAEEADQDDEPQLAEELPEECAAPEEVAAPRKVAVRKGKVVFEPCLEFAKMAVPADVELTPGLSFHLDFKCPVLEFILGMHGFRRSRKDPNWTLWWTSGSTVRASMLQSLLSHQKVNHFPRSSEISRKDRMSENIYRMQQQHGHKSFDLVPQTFVLPRQQELLVEACQNDPEALWIVKPIASSCGRGIFVTDKLSQIPELEPLVVSRYLANPLLIDGHKFDLRVYVLVTSFDPLRIYIYEEGLARFATEKYDMSKDSLKNSCVHLTNYSINKHSAKFNNDDEDSEGHKWSLTAFREHLCKCGIDDKLLFDRIHDLVVRALLSVEPSVRSACAMYQTHHSSCFEMFGFDIMVENNLRPWLIEVNLSPSLACPVEIDRRIKSNLIADMLNVLGLSARPPHTQKPSKKTSKPQKRPKPVLDENRYTYTGEQTSFSQTLLGEVSAEDRKVIKEVQAEMERAHDTNFKCVFPTQHSVSYSSYFDGPRPLNALLARLLWSQVGMDLTAAKAKVLARSGMVPFWKEDSKSRLRSNGGSPQREARDSTGRASGDEVGLEALSRSARLSSHGVSPKSTNKRGVGCMAGISPILSRFQSLPSSKEIKDLSEQADKLELPTL